ncbi:MAG: LysM peptidoglycan-binding domain-containing protein [Anaerolineae bacterium]|jgi:hypothetical protein
MQTRRALQWLTLILTVLISGCIEGVYEAPPGTSEPAPSPTPIVVFEQSPPPTPSPGVASPPSIYLEPATLNLMVGETQTVRIWIDEAWRLNGILLELSFNPNYLQVEDADPDVEGVQIEAGAIPEPVQVTRNEVAIDDGRIFYQVSQEAGSSVSGSGVVASIRIRGTAEGGSPLRFESVATYDPEGRAIDATSLAVGLITVTGGDATPEPSPQPTAAATAATPVATAAPTVFAPPSPIGGGGIFYVLRSDDNLFRVGLRFGTTAQAIAAASDIVDPGEIQAGEMVLVPVTPPQGNYGYYVQPHDTVYRIARRFGMTVEEVIALNGIGPDYHIEVGQILTVTP